jgi:RNA polymerase sigma-70 factor (ECF subfamily)
LENAHDAEDAVQDALAAAYKNLSQFKGEAKLSTWFTTIVTNAARMQRRRKHALVSLEEQLCPGEGKITFFEMYADKGPGPEDTCAENEIRKLVAQAVNRLSPASQKAFRLYYFDDMTVAETSEALGISAGTIKAQLARARAKISRLLHRELRPQVTSPSNTDVKTCLPTRRGTGHASEPLKTNK